MNAICILAVSFLQQRNGGVTLSVIRKSYSNIGIAKTLANFGVTPQNCGLSGDNSLHRLVDAF